jgi:GH35 family endo-1,4-beta-xylanase
MGKSKKVEPSQKQEFPIAQNSEKESVSSKESVLSEIESKPDMTLKKDTVLQSPDVSAYSLDVLGISEYYVGVENKNDGFYSDSTSLFADFEPIQKLDLSRKTNSNSCMGNEQSVEDQKFEDGSTGVKIQVNNRTDKVWGLGMRFKWDEIAYNDTDAFLLVFYAKCLQTEDESGEGKIVVQATEPYISGPRNGPLVMKSISVGRDWKLYAIPFPTSKKGNGLKLELLLGNTKPQTLMIKNCEIAYYGQKYTLAQLPKSSTKYLGMELDAAWRQEAIERIEAHRKENFAISLLSADGQPIKGAQVQAKLAKHDFGFGAAVNVKMLFDKSKYSEEVSKKYESVILESFNKITFENALKWKLYEYFKEYVPDAMDWAKKNNLPIRGHTLIWPGWNKSPKHLKELSKDKKAFKEAIMERVRDFSGRWTDQVVEWDVLNEPFSSNDFMKVLGKDIVLDIFNESERVNPDVIKYINDYAILAGNHVEHQKDYLEWVQYLHDNNAPIDAIGFQGHFRSPVTPVELLQRIGKYEKFGYDMQITEYDFDESDEVLQARFTRDLMTVVFSHPQMVGIVCWTLTPKADRLNHSMFREDFTPKPMMKV